MAYHCCKDSNSQSPSVSEVFPRGWLENERRPHGPVMLPGAWAMGEGLMLELSAGDSQRRSSHCHPWYAACASTSPSAAVTAVPSPSLGLSWTAAADWTSSVGSYLQDLASALGAASCSCSSPREAASCSSPREAPPAAAVAAPEWVPVGNGADGPQAMDAEAEEIGEDFVVQLALERRSLGPHPSPTCHRVRAAPRNRRGSAGSACGHNSKKDD